MLQLQVILSGPMDTENMTDALKVALSLMCDWVNSFFLNSKAIMSYYFPCGIGPLFNAIYGH